MMNISYYSLSAQEKLSVKKKTMLTMIIETQKNQRITFLFKKIFQRNSYKQLSNSKSAEQQFFNLRLIL